MIITSIILFLLLFVVYVIGEEIGRKVDGIQTQSFPRRLALNAKASWKWWVGYSLGILGMNHYKGDDKNGLLQVGVATAVFLLIVLVGAVQNREKEIPNQSSEATPKPGAPQ